MWRYNQTHLVQVERTDLACEYMIHEFRKLFKGASTQTVSEGIRRLVPRSDSDNVVVRDFWNLFCTTSSGWKLKDLHAVVTDENVNWVREQIPLSSLRPQTPQGWMTHITPYTFDAAVLYLQEKSNLEQAVNDPDEYANGHPEGMQNDAIIAISDQSSYEVCDGNGRLAHALLEWVVEGKSHPHPTMTVWVGRKKGQPSNCWIPTASLFFLKNACSEANLDIEQVVGNISHLALREYQDRVKARCSYYR
jgi:hypothetical protein